MATIDVVDLEAFVAVMRASSFTRAAKSLRTQKAHLSRVIRARSAKDTPPDAPSPRWPQLIAVT